MKMFKEVADIKTADELNLPTPKMVYETIVVKPTELQKEMVQNLAKRADWVRKNPRQNKKDNMLKITSDGRKIGLDQRVFNPMLPDDENSKVNACVNNIYRIWEDGKEDKLTQLLFCDLSTPKGRVKEQEQRAAKAGGRGINGLELHALEDALPEDILASDTPFSIYDDIRSKLIAKGVPPQEIVFIHDAKTEVKKKELFANVRNGNVRVLLGSTAKCGSGMNVQDRLIAVHDLDAPWRPGDLRQRSGRIERQGNNNDTAYVYRYVTEATFDSYLWQTLENKQKFISQIMTSKSPVREYHDTDETALSYAEIKALCAGNPKIKERMDLDVEVARLKILKASHQSSQYRLEDNLLRHYPESIKQNQGYIKCFEQDMATLAKHTPKPDEFSPMIIKGDILIDKDNAGAAILAAYKEIKNKDSVEIGTYKGFTMHLSYSVFGNEHTLTLKGAMSHTVTLGSDAKGNLTRIENALNAIPGRLTSVQSQLENLCHQQESAKVELGKPFLQEMELKEKSNRLAMITQELKMGDHVEAVEPAQSVAIAKAHRPSVLDTLQQMPKSVPKPKHERTQEVR